MLKITSDKYRKALWTKSRFSSNLRWVEMLTGCILFQETVFYNKNISFGYDNPKAVVLCQPPDGCEAKNPVAFSNSGKRRKRKEKKSQYSQKTELMRPVPCVLLLCRLAKGEALTYRKITQNSNERNSSTTQKGNQCWQPLFFSKHNYSSSTPKPVFCNCDVIDREAQKLLSKVTIVSYCVNL